MNSHKSLFWLLVFAWGMVACQSDNDDAVVDQTSIQVNTGSVQETGLTNVTLGGTTNSSVSKDVEVGIAYCLENETNAMSYAQATNLGKETGIHSFSVTIKGLQPDKTYTYYAYAKYANGSISKAREQKKFRTKSPEELLEYNAIQYVSLNDAMFCWEITDDKLYSELSSISASFGVAWSTDRYDLTSVNDMLDLSTQRLVVFDNGQKASFKLKSLNPGTTYYYSSYVNMNGKWYVAPIKNFSTITVDGFAGTAPSNAEAIDLGLPSGTKWANMNVGAVKAEETGLFFAWGETVGYKPEVINEESVFTGKTFDWFNYKWCNDSRDSQTKYCTNGDFGYVDNRSILDLADDAAYINWGDDWRTPTKEEVDELLTNTKYEWDTQNGMGGYRFTSKTNGKSIFLPAAGCGFNESHYDLGRNGYYWSATVDQPKPYSSLYICFHADILRLASLRRYEGMTVRPVYRK